VRTHAFAHLRRFAPDSLRHVGNRETLNEMLREPARAAILAFFGCSFFKAVRYQKKVCERVAPETPRMRSMGQAKPGAAKHIV
jgi:hypothetical protein